LPSLTEGNLDIFLTIFFVISVLIQIFIQAEDKAAPYKQRIRSASAQVQVIMQQEGPDDSYHRSQRSYLSFRKGNETLLTMAAYGATDIEEGNGRIRMYSMLDMDAHDPAIGHSVSELQKSDVIQIQFVSMPKNASIIEGRAVVTVNSMVQLEITIPAQDTNTTSLVLWYIYFQQNFHSIPPERH
jgi:hypothetical protein